MIVVDFKHKNRQTVEILAIIIIVSQPPWFHWRDMRGMSIYREIAISFSRAPAKSR